MRRSWWCYIFRCGIAQQDQQLFCRTKRRKECFSWLTPDIVLHIQGWGVGHVDSRCPLMLVNDGKHGGPQRSLVVPPTHSRQTVVVGMVRGLLEMCITTLRMYI